MRHKPLLWIALHQGRGLDSVVRTVLSPYRCLLIDTAKTPQKCAIFARFCRIFVEPSRPALSHAIGTWANEIRIPAAPEFSDVSIRTGSASRLIPAHTTGHTGPYKAVQFA
jgi:hypothetical protein